MFDDLDGLGSIGGVLAGIGLNGFEIVFCDKFNKV